VGYLFTLPWLFGFFAFFFYPLVKSLTLAFGQVVSMSGLKTKWAGLANFERAFVWDINFVPMLLRTVSGTLVNTPFIVVFALFVAIMLNRRIVLRGFFRGAVFLPVLLGSGFVLRQLLGGGSTSGQEEMNLVRGISVPPELFLYLGPRATLVAQDFLNRLTVIFWRSGVQILLFLAGLQSLPSSLQEVAKCEGATEWEYFWKVRLPMISPVIALNTIYTLVDSFSDSTNPIVDYVIGIGFRSGQFAYAAAVGWIYFAFVFALVTATYFIFRSFTYYQGGR
jgi:ABC-type sugar transport system permease subunit